MINSNKLSNQGLSLFYWLAQYRQITVHIKLRNAVKTDYIFYINLILNK